MYNIKQIKNSENETKIPNQNNNNNIISDFIDFTSMAYDKVKNKLSDYIDYFNRIEIKNTSDWASLLEIDDDSKVKEYYNLDAGESNFDLYLPSDNSKDTYGLILYIHGGLFKLGNSSEGEDWGKYYASKGYVCASINYPLINEDNSVSINDISNYVLNSVNDINNKTKEMIKSKEYMELINKLSPTELVKNSKVPTICAYGTEDDVFNPTNQVNKFTNNLINNNKDNKYYKFNNSNHGLDGNVDLMKELIDNVLIYMNK